MSHNSRSILLDEALANHLNPNKSDDHHDQKELANYSLDEELVELLSLAQTLNTLSDLSPRNEFKESSPGNLIANLPDRKMSLKPQRGLSRLPKLPVLNRRTITFFGILAMLMIFLLMSGGILYTASAAGPGDFRYGLKLQLEQVKLSQAPDKGSVIRIHLDLSAERLRETQEEFHKGEIKNALLALNAYENEVQYINKNIQYVQGSEQDILMELFTNTSLVQLEILNLILASVPQNAQSAIQHAKETLCSVVNLPSRSSEFQTNGVPELIEDPDQAGKPEDEITTSKKIIPTIEPKPDDLPSLHIEGSGPPQKQDLRKKPPVIPDTPLNRGDIP